MKKRFCIFPLLAVAVGLSACSGSANPESSAETAEQTVEETEETVEEEPAVISEKDAIESELNLANNEEQEWTYQADADAWVLSVVPAVTNPELPDQQGVSVCVPGAYVVGIDTDGDGLEDVVADSVTGAAAGRLVIDYDAQIVSTHGQIYTAMTAPVILNTGAAGYGSSTNTAAATTYAAEGYINVSCGNRGKQDTAEDADGNIYYTGDAPSCLVDQKNATRFVKYNILLGNLPGSTDYFVSTGGSGGGAHATMFAATSDNPDFYDYEIEAGAVGVYRLDDGTYSTTVTIDGEEHEISDGAWGCMAYSAITPLAEGDMAMAFEYYMDTTYDFGTPFQAQLAEYLSAAYMEYINGQNLSVKEADVGFDLDGDGDLDDTIALTIAYDPDDYPETNGYHGSYLDLYLAEFCSNLQWYLDNLEYADGWTWFDETGAALSDADVATMTVADRSEAFLEGRYAKKEAARGGPGGMGGGLPSGMNGAADFAGPDGMNGGRPDGGRPDGGMSDGGRERTGGMPDDGQLPGDAQPDGLTPGAGGPAEDKERSFANNAVAENSAGDTMDVGTPDAGTTQAAGSGTDSANYSSYEEMVEAYSADIEELQAGDRYGKNPVDLYNPLNYIGAEGTKDPAWVRILMGAAEGDMSMFNSLNLQIAMLNAGVDANIEWQWDGGHVPSEIFSESFALYVDQMYGKHVNGMSIETPTAEPQTENGTDEAPSGSDLTAWVDASDPDNVTFSLADAVAYRTKGASKAIPGFDVIDYGQEDYVFGNTERDARHWNGRLLEIFEEHADVLEPLFNNR